MELKGKRVAVPAEDLYKDLDLPDDPPGAVRVEGVKPRDMELSDKRCVPCRGKVPVMGAEDAEKLISQDSGWTLAVLLPFSRNPNHPTDRGISIGMAREIAGRAVREGISPEDFR